MRETSAVPVAAMAADRTRCNFHVPKRNAHRARAPASPRMGSRFCTSRPLDETTFGVERGGAKCKLGFTGVAMMTQIYKFEIRAVTGR